MAQYSSASVIFKMDDTNGDQRTITSFLRSIGNISIEAIIQEATVFGASWATYVSTAIKKGAAITLGGFYDTTVTSGPDVLFAGHEGETRAGCEITYGGGKTTTFDVIIQKFERLPKLGAMTEYSVTLQPTGTMIDA
jgi:hypothetical protein